jgi:hypothetical protein
MRILISAGVPLFAVAVYGIGMFLFISVVWSKWYPVLQNKLNPTLVKWVFKFMLNGLAGFGGYMYAHYYLNSLTGVDPNNFPKTLLAFTVPFAGYIWSIFIALSAGLIVLAFLLLMLGITAWNGLVRIGTIPFLVGVLLVRLCKFLFCAFDQFLKTIPDYTICKERFLTPLSESDQPKWLQVKDIRIRTFLTYLFGPVAIIACMAILEKLPQHPPLDRLMHRAATSVLVFADFAHDRTCSVSSATRWVAPLKDRNEQDSPKVLIADLSTWPDIQSGLWRIL